MHYTISHTARPDIPLLHLSHPQQDFIVMCDPRGTWDDGHAGSIYALQRFAELLNSDEVLSSADIFSITQTINQELAIKFPGKTTGLETATFSLILISFVNNTATLFHAAIFQAGLIRQGQMIAQTQAKTVRDQALENGIVLPDDNPMAGIFVGPVFGANDALVEPPWELQPGDGLVIAYRQIWDRLTAADWATLSARRHDPTIAHWLQQKDTRFEQCQSLMIGL